MGPSLIEHDAQGHGRWLRLAKGQDDGSCIVNICLRVVGINEPDNGMERFVLLLQVPRHSRCQECPAKLDKLHGPTSSPVMDPIHATCWAVRLCSDFCSITAQNAQKMALPRLGQTDQSHTTSWFLSTEISSHGAQFIYQIPASPSAAPIMWTLSRPLCSGQPISLIAR